MDIIIPRPRRSTCAFVLGGWVAVVSAGADDTTAATGAAAAALTAAFNFI